MRPPVIATLVLLFGILAAIPFRRHQSSERAAIEPAVATLPGTEQSVAPRLPRTEYESPLQITADEVDTALTLQQQLAGEKEPGTSTTDFVEPFHTSYAETAVKLVEPPAVVDGWNDELKTVEHPTTFAIPDSLLATDNAASRVREPRSHNTSDGIPAEMAAIRREKETRAEEDYAWNELELKAEFSLNGQSGEPEEIPAPHATHAQNRLTTVGDGQMAGRRTEPSHAATPPRPQPRKRYFIREPASSINR